MENKDLRLQVIQTLKSINEKLSKNDINVEKLELFEFDKKHSVIISCQVIYQIEDQINLIQTSINIIKKQLSLNKDIPFYSQVEQKRKSKSDSK